MHYFATTYKGTIMTYHFDNDRFTTKGETMPQTFNYFVFGYDTDGKLMPMRQQGFDDLTSALHYLSTIDPHWRAFASVRLTNV